MMDKADEWAIVELMGHVKLAGRLTEVERFGSKMGRLDIPQDDGNYITQFFGGGSVYRITAVSEDVAKAVAKGNQSHPVSAWDWPKALPERQPAPSIHDDSEDEDDFDDNLDPKCF